MKKLYYRFGDIPEDGYSSIWRIDELIGMGKVLAANVFGKLKTIFQMIALPVVFLNGWPFSYFDLGWNTNGRNSLCKIGRAHV